tara:strand:- start:17381 stop:19801 length:2421 start_codon:yes stop_codon:yes gene_type:complete
MKTLSLSLSLLATAASLSSSLIGQAPNEFDFDTHEYGVTQISPNGPNGTTHEIIGFVSYADARLELPADLIVRTGGELVLSNCELIVDGAVLLEDGSRLTVLDSSFLIHNDFQHQHEMTNHGGLLHTERSLFGSQGNNGLIPQCRFRHLRGTWVARHTVLQGLITQLSEGRHGWGGDPSLPGGTLWADGLYSGNRADAIHVGGLGDALLANGTMNVAFYYDAEGATQPIAATIDLDSTQPLSVVYGDPAVHDGVTASIPNFPRRLELRNHRSVTWQFFALNVAQTGPLHSLTLQNADDVIASFKGEDLAGAPILAGPWGTHYSQLPGLPSTGKPGFHSIPPDCSVQLGNVEFRSGPGVADWNRVLSWGVYLEGTGSNLSITGPTRIAEIYMDGGALSLQGTGSYDMGVIANTASLKGGANLTVSNGAIGDFAADSTLVALIHASEDSSCSISQVRAAPLRLKTNGGLSAITADDVIGVENVIIDTSGGGSVQLLSATAAQNTDLQNLDMEAAGNGIPYWTSTGLSGVHSSSTAPGSLGSWSRELSTQSLPASVEKSLNLPPDTSVELYGSSSLLQGAAPQARIAQGPTQTFSPLPSTGPSFERFFVAPFLTGSNGPLLIGLDAASTSTFGVDDLHVQVASWWDNHNLANLSFEAGFRFTGRSPAFWSAPDYWSSTQAQSFADSANVRPGAAAGSTSARIVIDGATGAIYKDIDYLRAGDELVLEGWMRGIIATGPGWVRAGIGDGLSFWQPSGNNVSTQLPVDGSWQWFSLTYVVPPNPTFTRLNLSAIGSAGMQAWFDDLTVVLQ